MRNEWLFIGVIGVSFGLSGCVISDDGPSFGDEGVFFDPDDAITFDPDDDIELPDVETGGSDAFTQPFDGISDNNRQRFSRGQALFRQTWPVDKLGPVFNETSCAGCHVLDGRSDPDARGLLFRLSVPGPSPEPTYGGQLQPIGMFAPAEGQVITSWEEEPFELDDSTVVTLRRPRFRFVALGYGELDDGFEFSPRLAQQTFGLGLLEAIPEDALLAGADEDDEDGDGISGRPNWVEDVRNDSVALGRFGWKAGQPNLEQQNAAAFNGDLGMTSVLFPDSPCTDRQQECLDEDSGDPEELLEEELKFVTRYTRLLAPPARRDADSPAVRRGERLFEAANCDACHVPQWQTGDVHLDVLSDRTIHPYTDLLLHDMGAGLADGRPEANAGGREWRTPPLWGIGLLDEVNGHTSLLHDGRARNVAEAILWHGGEAEASRDAFAAMTQEERSDLVRFVNSL